MDPHKLQELNDAFIYSNELLIRILNSPTLALESKQTCIKHHDLMRNLFHKEKCRQTSCDD